MSETLSSNARAIDEVKLALQAVAQAIGRGASPEQVCELLYDDAAVVTGEGMPGAISGRAACIELLAEVFKEWGPGASVSYAWHEPAVIGQDNVSTLVQVNVTPAGTTTPSMHYRVLYVWTRGRRGWRVKLEMFGAGTL